MGQLFLFIIVALTVAAIIFGVTVLMSGGDPGLTPVEPDGRALPLPGDRPLGEEDVVHARFDTAVRGYRMGQVDQALQRAAYDIGYKGELIGVLEAEVTALREGRTEDADVLRRAREAAVQPTVAEPSAEVSPVGDRSTATAVTGAQAPAAQAPAAQVPGADARVDDVPVDDVPDDVIDAPVAAPPVVGTAGPAAAVAAVPPPVIPAADKPAAGKPPAGKPAAGKPAADKGAADKREGDGAGPAENATTATVGATDDGTTAESR